MDIVCFSKDIWPVFTLFEILGKAREKLKWADGKAVKAEIDMQVCGTIACYKSVYWSNTKFSEHTLQELYGR